MLTSPGERKYPLIRNVGRHEHLSLSLSMVEVQVSVDTSPLLRRIRPPPATAEELLVAMDLAHLRRLLLRSGLISTVCLPVRPRRIQPQQNTF